MANQVSVIFDGNKLIPAPFISIEKQYQMAEDTTILGATYNITLNGVITATKGSPDASGTFWTGTGYPPDSASDVDRMRSLLEKQRAIRTLFNKDSLGKVLEIHPCDTSVPWQTYPKVKSVVFQEGQWWETARYSIGLEADAIFGLDSTVEDDFQDNYLKGASESWNLAMDETPLDASRPRTWKLSHNLSAVGKKYYDSNGLASEAWEQAKVFCITRAGLQSVTGIYELGDTSAYNHVRVENVGEFDGSYQLSETWILAEDSAIEDFTVTINSSVTEPLVRVSIEGSIRGMDEIEIPDGVDIGDQTAYTVTTTKYENAETKWDEVYALLLTRAQTYAGINLNIVPLVTIVGKNPVTGVVTYRYEYDNRPSNCIDGALVELITISDNNPSDVFVAIPVIGRSSGPVLQSLSTITERSRGINIELIMPIYSGGCPTSASGMYAMINASPKAQVDIMVQAMEDQLTAISAANMVFKSQDTESWQPKSGRYNRTVAFVWQYCI